MMYILSILFFLSPDLVAIVVFFFQILSLISLVTNSAMQLFFFCGC